MESSYSLKFNYDNRGLGMLEIHDKKTPPVLQFSAKTGVVRDGELLLPIPTGLWYVDSIPLKTTWTLPTGHTISTGWCFWLLDCDKGMSGASIQDASHATRFGVYIRLSYCADFRVMLLLTNIFEKQPELQLTVGKS